MADPEFPAEEPAPRRRTVVKSTPRAIPLIHPTLVHPTPALATMIPEEVARRLRVLPVLVSGGSTLWLAMEDPSDEAALAECARVTRMNARAMAASGDEIRASFHRWYGGAPPRPSQSPKPPPVAPPPRARQISVLELDVTEVVQASIPPPPMAAPDPPPPPAAVLVVQGFAGLADACREAFEGRDVSFHEADLVEAAEVARALAPFAIVLPEDVFAFDPFAFESLAVSTRALLVTASGAGAPHLRPVLTTAHKRLFG